MKIVSVSVTDDTGIVHTWEGIEGWVKVRNRSAKNQPYQETVVAHLLLPAKGEIKA